MSSEVLFISDLHLDQERPEITEQFVNFLQTRASQARVLYILGDLFEVWLGDDDPAEAFSTVFSALQAFNQSRQCYFMHGNRDFLIGTQLAQKLGFEILVDPSVIVHTPAAEHDPTGMAKSMTSSPGLAFASRMA